MKIVIPQEYGGTVVTSQFISPKVIFQQIKSDRPITFTPGQYASFLLGAHRRPLSYASLSEEELLDFAIDISPDGVCSRYARAAKPGDTVRFLAPYGRFVLEEAQNRPALFIATGTGIAPIRSQLKQLFKQNFNLPVTLVFGNYTEDHLLFRHEFEKLAQEHSNFTFVPVLSDADKPWAGETGWVTHVVPRIIPNIPEWSAYVCGNPPMVKDMVALLLQSGLSKQFIHSEQFTYAN